MKKIFCLNKIASCGTDLLDKSKYTVSVNAADIDSADAVMVRSAVMHDMTFAPTLKAIARAGAGVNNIPVERCASEGIVVFNTPGANANGVEELAICALMLASRDIAGAIRWADTLAGTEGVAKAVEAGKSKFAGVEIKGKTLGVIGLGAIGALVANAAVDLGMKVIGCDPFLSVDAAWKLNPAVEKAATFDEVFAIADYITLHVPSTVDTKGMINESSLAGMKDGVRIINLARADLVSAADIKAAIESGKVASYVTDFPTEETVGVKGIVAIPHLGASTAEAEDNCAVMAVLQLDDFLCNGNIKNSVNFPNVSMPRSSDTRICILHKAGDDMLSTITSAVRGVIAVASKAKGENAYTIVDVSGDAHESVVALNATEGVYRAYTV